MKTSKELIEILENKIEPHIREIIFEFFITFSRAEYSLKKNGFLEKNNKKANPDWNEFIKSIKIQFEEAEKDESISNAIHYIINYPPRIQLNINNQIDWKERLFSENTSTVCKLLQSIKGVRNNLFHGGKYDLRVENEVARDYDLLYSSLLVLNFWLTLNEQVRIDFLNFE